MSAAGTAVSVELIFLAARCLPGWGCLTGWPSAGAGTLVPITGFASAVVSPALEFRVRGLVITGTARQDVLIAGPVLAYGIRPPCLRA